MILSNREHSNIFQDISRMLLFLTFLPVTHYLIPEIEAKKQLAEKVHQQQFQLFLLLELNHLHIFVQYLYSAICSLLYEPVPFLFQLIHMYSILHSDWMGLLHVSLNKSFHCT